MGCLPVLVLLSLAVTAAVTDQAVYCQLDSNEYYVRQWGQCKACDRCPQGYGLDSKKSVEVHPVYGALRCRGCLKCTLGETFKSKRGYEDCQRCTNCTLVGKQVATPCTTVSDAVCVDIPPKEISPTNLQQRGQEPVVPEIAASNEKRPEKEATGINLTTTLIGVLALAICVSTSVIVILQAKRKGFDCWGKNCPRPSVDEEQGALEGGDGPVTMETSFDPESIPLKNLEPPNDLPATYERQESVENDDYPPLSSRFSYNLESDLDLDMRDVEPDAGRLFDTIQVFDSRSHEVPSDRELQGLCSSIAHNNLYARLGRELGVKDNEIKRIKEEQNSDLLETAFQTLKKWREMKGTGATKGVLRQALRTVGLGDGILKDDS